MAKDDYNSMLYWGLKEVVPVGDEKIIQVAACSVTKTILLTTAFPFLGILNSLCLMLKACRSLGMSFLPWGSYVHLRALWPMTTKSTFFCRNCCLSTKAERF